MLKFTIDSPLIAGTKEYEIDRKKFVGDIKSMIAKESFYSPQLIELFLDKNKVLRSLKNKEVIENSGLTDGCVIKMTVKEDIGEKEYSYLFKFIASHLVKNIEERMFCSFLDNISTKGHVPGMIEFFKKNYVAFLDCFQECSDILDKNKAAADAFQKFFAQHDLVLVQRKKFIEYYGLDKDDVGDDILDNPIYAHAINLAVASAEEFAKL